MNREKSPFVQAMDSVKASEELKNRTLAYAAAGARKAPSVRKKRFAAVSAVCAALFVLLAAVGFYLYTSPVSAISIDVNPSVELEMNRFGRVLSCKAYNDDGASVAQSVNVANMSYAEAVKTILRDPSFRKYVKEDAYVVITVAGDRVEEIAGALSKEPALGRISAAVETAEMETVGEAHSCGFSFGKYKAYLELLALDDTLTEEEARSLSMHELRSRIVALGGTVSGGCQAEESEHDQSREKDDCDGGRQKGRNGGGKGSGHRNGRH